MARKRTSTTSKSTKKATTTRSKKKVEVPVIEREEFIDDGEQEELKKVVEEVEEKEPEKEKEVEVIDTDPLLRWRKTGGGSLRFPNRIIKPNEIFLARRSEIPKIFMDGLVLLDDEPVVAVQKKENKSPIFKLKERDDSLFDIVNVQDKPINENPLTEDEAKKLLSSLL